MEISELTPEDDYLEYCKLLKQLTTIDLDLINKEDFINQVKTIQSNPYHKIFVAKVNKNIIGSITIIVEPKIIHNFSRVAHIEDVVVDVSKRSSGIGTLLVKRAIEFSKNIGCYKIILDCNDSNLVFYQKLGFSKKECQMALYL